MNPIQFKSIRSGSPRRFPAALAASLSRACPRLLAFAALCLFALPGVSRADSVTDWYPDGTISWSTDRTVTRYFQVGTYASSSNQWCVLDQTAGTITAQNQTVIIGQAAFGPSAYNMSGSAVFNSGTQNLRIGNVAHTGNTSNTWSLTDNATATIGLLSFNISNGHVLLAGAASVSATDLNFGSGTGNYINFATGSTATFTGGNKSLSDYQALVAAGNIRVDGVVQSDFSAFQVAGHTLSLSTGGPPPPHLVITSVSPASPTAGTGFDVTVETQDDGNAPANVTADTEVTLTRKSGTGTLGGIVSGTITANSSSVTISGVTYTKAESGVVLEVSGGGLAAADSTPFTVVPGAPAKLAFGVQPSATSTGVAISPAVTVLVQDDNGNTVTGDASSVTIGSSTTGFTPGSVLTVSAVDGVATFDTIEPTTDGTGNTLTASDGDLTGATSNSFTVGADSVTDWTVTGTVNRSSSRTVTRYFTVGITESPGTLNQTAGTITGSASGLIIGQVMSGSSSGTYNMSGAAQFSMPTGQVILGNSLASAAVATWSLADTAAATIGTLAFGQASQAVGSRYLLLSGAATFTATSLAFNNTGTTAGNMNYLSFATGSTATFTAGDKVEADYQALVTAGNIRVDGVVQTDFSAFQVTGNTLSLATGGPGADYTAWIALYPGFTDTNPTHDPDGDGLSNQQEYAFGLDPTMGSSANPIVAPLDQASGQFSYTRRATSGLAYTVEYSTDLAAWNPATLAGPESVGTPDSYGVETVTVTVTNEPVNGELFVRVRAE
ncbi:MAG: hypothetical protein NTW21_03220 [Verrucomicrobia bacterium]|nr:hypothetical protein [Verrucomicrobiota bacterium]